MWRRLQLTNSVLLLVVCLAPLRLQAMDLVHYDLESLVFLSTDIVVANIAESEPQQFTALVVETLYGTLKAGDRIEGLKPFLSFFQPMHAGLKVILFLDRRPHKYDFLHSDAAKSPFAVPPSGIYLVDEYDHVHQYYQLSNPGSYVAQGYSYFFTKREPTKEQDVALVSLAQEEQQIAAAVKKVEALRPLLGREATAGDVPALFAVLDSRSRELNGCFRRGGSDAIAERAAGLIESLRDPALLLKLQEYHNRHVSARALCTAKRRPRRCVCHTARAVSASNYSRPKSTTPDARSCGSGSVGCVPLPQQRAKSGIEILAARQRVALAISRHDHKRCEESV